MSAGPNFDPFADCYDAHLNAALSITGEDKDYFANARVQWLSGKLKLLQENPCLILDYGCGTGDTCPLLLSALNARSVVGVDVSTRSVEIARLRNRSPDCSFSSLAEYIPDSSVDAAYCNGVFHHIPVAGRTSAARYVFRCLRPGGVFAFWENNPWNPATRFVMSRCAFDQDAVTLTTREACCLLKESGFEILGVDYCFFFPRLLGVLRFLEPTLSCIPLGGQYQILCRKPNS
jgi:SAM-dependent methyltransferase